MYYNSKYEDKSIDEIVNEKLKSIFLILVSALGLTLGTVLLIRTNTDLLNTVYNFYSIIIIAELIVATVLSVMVYKSKNKSILLILLYIYSILTGATLTIITLVFTFESVISVLGGTIALFTVLSLYGYATNQDLSKFGTLLFVSLIAMIIIGIINIFLGNSMLEIILSFLGVFIFMFYTAYDVNVIKSNLEKIAISGDSEFIDRITIIGAFSLYLDFINLFLYLLRLFGKSRD